MPLAPEELITYASASRPQDEASLTGGAIDLKTRVIFTDLAAHDKVEVVSTSGSDTQDCTITGRLADGTIAAETITLTGTTVALAATNFFERILSVALTSDAIGTVTVRRQDAGETVADIPPGERGFVRMFINAASHPTDEKTFFEKFFWKNTSDIFACVDAEVGEAVDPEGDPQGVITHALASTKDDSGTVANRNTAPAGLTFTNANAMVPGGSLAPGEAIGVWLQMTLPAGLAGFKSTYVSRISGTST